MLCFGTTCKSLSRVVRWTMCLVTCSGPLWGFFQPTHHTLRIRVSTKKHESSHYKLAEKNVLCFDLNSTMSPSNSNSESAMKRRHCNRTDSKLEDFVSRFPMNLMSAYFISFFFTGFMNWKDLTSARKRRHPMGSHDLQQQIRKEDTDSLKKQRSLAAGNAIIAEILASFNRRL